MKLNFKGFGDASLCDRCDHGMIMKTSNGERKVYCNGLMKYVPPNVIECNEYQPKGSQSKYDMEKQAWDIEIKNGRVIGFKPPTKKSNEFF